MAIGARIRNDGGSLVQIDPSFECLALKQAGITTTAPSYTVPSFGGKTIGKTTVSASGCNEPILALFCSGAYIGVMSKTQSGTTFSWDVVTDVPGASFTYWIFDTTDVAQIQFSGNRGLRIRNPANNRVIFDSRYKYMRIEQQIATAASTASTDIGIPLTSNYAFGVSTTGLYYVSAGGPVGGGPSWLVNQVGYFVGVKTNTNSTVSVKLVELRNWISDGPAPPSPPTGQMGDNSIRGVILDMRNY